MLSRTAQVYEIKGKTYINIKKISKNIGKEPENAIKTESGEQPLLSVFVWSKCGDSNSVPLGPKRTYKGNFR